MREILFRGKRMDNGEWEYGYLYGIWEQRYILWRMTNNVHNMVEVDPETICQYTGLTDKNGKKIWEGDILEGHLDDKFPEDVTREKVIWHENGWKTEESRCDDKAYLDEFDAENFEVVGNVFDNPELLEV